MPSSPNTSVVVRPFRRDDRDQLTDLVNAHVAAVVPGMSVSVNAVLSQLEREPGEFVVDPWVDSRATLVAEQRGRVVAAAHLLRYADGPHVGASYRGLGEIRWLLCWPDAPFWPDSAAAAHTLAAAAVRYLERSGAGRIDADGTLPAAGVYGIPEQWPHVQDVLRRAGFVPGDRLEVVLLADVADLAYPPAPLPGMTLRRCLGAAGTRLTAGLDDAAVGYVEVDLRLGDTGRLASSGGWADIGNLWVEPVHRRRGIGRWLLGQAADWLRLGRCDRLLDYCGAGDTAYLAFARAVGYRELTRTTRGWSRLDSSRLNSS